MRTDCYVISLNAFVVVAGVVVVVVVVVVVKVVRCRRCSLFLSYFLFENICNKRTLCLIF